MSKTTTDVFLNEGDTFTPGTTCISGKDMHTIRLGGVTIYGTLAELTQLADSLTDAVAAHERSGPRVVNHAEYARVKRIHRAHPDWPLAACISHAADQADEYAADTRSAALGASDE